MAPAPTAVVPAVAAAEVLEAPIAMAATPATTTPPAAIAAITIFVPVVSPPSASVLVVVVSASSVVVVTVLLGVVTASTVTVVTVLFGVVTASTVTVAATDDVVTASLVALFVSTVKLFVSIRTSHRVPVVKAGQVQMNPAVLELRHVAPPAHGWSRQYRCCWQYKPIHGSPQMHSLSMPPVIAIHVPPFLHRKLLHLLCHGHRNLIAKVVASASCINATFVSSVYVIVLR